ncbi:exportin-4 [Dendrobium catenatum]|nr:exportin-4 [Dendrobium catenatum]
MSPVIRINLFEGLSSQEFYCWAKDAAISLTDKIVSCNASFNEEKICSSAMRLMFQILSWNFRQSTVPPDLSNFKPNAFSAGIRHEATLLKKFERTLVQPGLSWREPLISSGQIAWVLNLYATLRQKLSADVIWFDSPLAVSTRELILQLCSLTGTVFPSDNGHAQINHLLQILSCIMQWIEPPEVVIKEIRLGRSESEFIDGCHALLSIATLTTPLLFNNLLLSLRPFGTIHFLSILTSDVVKTDLVNHDEEETWTAEALDILLETWNVIFGTSDGDKNSISAEGRAVSAKLFNNIVESYLEAAAATAYDEDDNAEHFVASVSKRDERLESYAVIARAAAEITIPFLINVFSQRVSHLNQIIGKSDPTRILEELYWILLMIGHVLMDAGEGETALIPETLKAGFPNFLEEAQHPVVVLSWSIIDFSRRSLDPETRAAYFSPRLMEAVVWFLARWVDTYLMPVDGTKVHISSASDSLKHGPLSSKRILLNFAGEHKQGEMVLDIIARICINALTSYPGEKELQALTCQKLLVALVRRRNVCSRLLSMDSWLDLARAFSNERSLFSLNPRLQRSLAENLVCAASSLKDAEASNQYVRDLIGPMTSYLAEMSARNDLKDIAQLPDAMYTVNCLLERLIGVARATQPRTQKALFDVCVAVMNPLITLLEAYKNQPSVVYLIIKFSVDFVDGQIAFLNAKDTSVLVSFCLQLLQAYSSQNIGKLSLSHSSTLLGGAQVEDYKDLLALLQLLTNLCSKDLIDFSPDETGSPDIAEVVFVGLHIVSPLISFDLLKFPKLSSCYFRLISHMLEVYPEKVVLLTKEAFAQVIASLDFGIQHQDLDAVDMCLRAINALASFLYRDKTVGREGLVARTVDSKGSNGELQENISSHFLRLLLQLVLFEDFRVDLTGSAADALLPLILCEQDLYQRLVQEFIDKQPIDSLRTRLAKSFHSLTSSNNLSSSLDRPNRHRFRKNFHEFLTEISGLRIK